MLYQDSERRIKDITEIADLFKKKGWQKTAEGTLNFIEILKGNKVPKGFVKDLDSLFNLCQKEFVMSVSVGQNYRKRCFEEVKDIVLNAIKRMGPDFRQALLNILPFLERLNEASSITDAIAEELGKKRVQSKFVVFHLRCYAYLILVEGIFDELARTLYFLTVMSKTNIPSKRDLERMNVWNILEILGTTPVFLEQWKEKKRIRDSIGHARAYYNPLKDEVRFVSVDEKTGKVTYDSGTIPFSRFAEMALELEDSLVAFYNTFLLLRIYDLVVSKTPYK